MQKGIERAQCPFCISNSFLHYRTPCHPFAADLVNGLIHVHVHKDGLLLAVFLKEVRSCVKDDAGPARLIRNGPGNVLQVDEHWLSRSRELIHHLVAPFAPCASSNAIWTDLQTRPALPWCGCDGMCKGDATATQALRIFSRVM